MLNTCICVLQSLFSEAPPTDNHLFTVTIFDTCIIALHIKSLLAEH